MVQAVEHLLYKHKAISSSPAKKIKSKVLQGGGGETPDTKLFFLALGDMHIWSINPNKMFP
jgi:hypothetical protein